MKHTPGPWTIQKEHMTAINAGDKHIAMVNYYKSGHPTDIFGEEHDANANLIHAAPDLLEACEAFERWGVLNPLTFKIDADFVKAMDLNRIAIAKARGE